MTLGILGGGLSGLSLAYFYGSDCEVLEKDSVCGGLCRTIKKGRFLYDLGGHIIFSADKKIRNIMHKMLGKNKKQYRRNNKIWFKKRFVKYPFENGLASLPKKDIYECLFHFLNRPKLKPRNYKEWCYYRFGKGIAEKYLIPYSEKIWKIPTNEMGLDWISGRIPDPPLEDILKSAIGIETEGYIQQLNFLYPKHGGIQSLIHAIEKKVHNIERNFEIRHISKSRGKWMVSDGKREKIFNRIVSTLPLPDLIRAFDKVPAHVKKAAESLRWNSLICIMLAVRSKKPSDKFAVYFPQPELLFHRICYYDFFGGEYAPEGFSTIVAEITCKPCDDIYKMEDSILIEKVVSGLSSQGFINPKDVYITDVARSLYGYVINHLSYRKNLKIIYDFTQQTGIMLCGRFAEWQYLNMDACIKHGMDCAARLRTG